MLQFIYTFVLCTSESNETHKKNGHKMQDVVALKSLTAMETSKEEQQGRKTHRIGIMLH
jgi:hypothetical protein